MSSAELHFGHFGLLTSWNRSTKFVQFFRPYQLRSRWPCKPITVGFQIRIGTICCTVPKASYFRDSQRIRNVQLLRTFYTLTGGALRISIFVKGNHSKLFQAWNVRTLKKGCDLTPQNHFYRTLSRTSGIQCIFVKAWVIEMYFLNKMLRPKSWSFYMS